MQNEQQVIDAINAAVPADVAAAAPAPCMSRIVLAGFLGAEVSKDNIKTYPKCEGI